MMGTLESFLGIFVDVLFAAVVSLFQAVLVGLQRPGNIASEGHPQGLKTEGDVRPARSERQSVRHFVEV